MRVLVFDDDAAVGRLAVRVATMSGMEATAVTEPARFARPARPSRRRSSCWTCNWAKPTAWSNCATGRAALRRRHRAHERLRCPRAGDSAGAGKNLDLNIEAVLQKPLRVTELEAVMRRLQSVGQSPSAERLLAAIANDELRLEFQPVVCAKPKLLKKLEALVRWDHPSSGRISPGDFLPLAETNTGVIDALTDWVIGAAVEAYLVLAELGVQRADHGERIDAQSARPDVARSAGAAAAGRRACRPRHLCLEITETAAFKRHLA